MRYYPIFLDVCGQLAVVVGGGKVAERKVRKLLRAGARVRVISPELTPGLARLAAAGRIRVSRRRYRKGELGRGRANRRSPVLVFAATNDSAAQRAVRKDAAGALVNLADSAEGSNFIVPASFTRGDLHVAISTSGTDPALSRALRLRFAAEFKQGKRRMAKGKGQKQEHRSQESEEQMQTQPGTSTKFLSLARKSVWLYP
jgi:siroheme synthase-like protein